MSNRWDAYFARSPEEGAQWALLALMTGISEGFWCAAWLGDLEYALWDAAQGGERSYGRGVITDRQATLLRLLSEEAGGWWVWDDLVAGPRFISLEDWQAVREAPASNAPDDDKIS